MDASLVIVRATFFVCKNASQGTFRSLPMPPLVAAAASVGAHSLPGQPTDRRRGGPAPGG